MTNNDSNYTKVPNSLFEIVAHVTPAQWTILSIVARQTYGWHKAEDTISLSQFARWTGMVRASVQTAIAQLLDRGFLLRRKVGAQQFAYMINMRAIDAYLDTTVPNFGTVDEADDQTVPNSGTATIPNSGTVDGQTVPNSGNTKENIKEKDKESNSSFSFPFSMQDNMSAQDSLSALLRIAACAIGKDDLSRADRDTIVKANAKHGPRIVCAAINMAHEAGRVDGLGYVVHLLRDRIDEVRGHEQCSRPKPRTFTQWLLHRYNINNPDLIDVERNVLDSKYREYVNMFSANGSHQTDRVAVYYADGVVPPRATNGLASYMDNV